MDLYLLFDHADGFVLYECKNWRFINESVEFIETFTHDEEAFLAAVKFKAFQAFENAGDGISTSECMFQGIIPEKLDTFLKVNTSSSSKAIIGTYDTYIAAGLSIKGYFYHSDEGVLALMRGCIRFGLFTFTDGLAKILQKLTRENAIRQEDASTNAAKVEAAALKKYTPKLHWLNPSWTELNVQDELAEYLESNTTTPHLAKRQNMVNQKAAEALDRIAPTLSILMRHWPAYEILVRVNNESRLSEYTNKKLLEIAGCNNPEETEISWDKKQYKFFSHHPLVLITPERYRPQVTLEIARLCRACGTIDKLKSPNAREFGRIMLTYLEQLVTSFKGEEKNNNRLKILLKYKIGNAILSRAGRHGRDSYNISYCRNHEIQFG